MTPGERDVRRDVEEGRARFDDEGRPYAVTSWAAVDLEPFKRGEIVIAPPKYLKRDDGRALIYPGRPHVFYGESESLKTWAALLAARDVPGNVLYLDLEGSEPSFVERCRHVGIPENEIGSRVVYVRPNEKPTRDTGADLDFELLAHAPELVVLDGVTELYALMGWDLYKADDAARFQRTFRFDCASIAIDHTAKDAGRGVFGSQHKRAGLDGAEYLFESRTRGGRGGLSIAQVSVTKDRHGHVREWTSGLVGYLEVAPDGVDLRAPKVARDLFDPKPIDESERVLTFVREHPSCSTADVQAGLKIKRSRVLDVLDYLATRGDIIDLGTRRAHKWVASS